MDLRQHRRDEEAAPDHGAVAGLEPRYRHLRPGLLQAPAEDVPRFPESRPGRARAAQGQLGPGGHDRARQRAGDRRPRLALRGRGRAARHEPVGVQDHRLRPGPARRARPARPLARQGAHHAAQLDRPLRGAAFRIRPGRRARGLRQAAGVHDPPRHHVRPDLRRDLAGPSAGPGAGGERPRGGRVHRRMPPHGHLAGRDRHRREARPRHRHQGRPSGRSGLAPAALHRQLRADGLRHRRRHRLPGARPARPRLRPQIRPAGDRRVRPGRQRRTGRGRRFRAGQDRDRAIRAVGRRARHHDLRAGDEALARHLRARRLGSPRGQFPPARLGYLAPALLGLSDPDDPLPGLRRGAGAGPGPAGGAAG